MMLTSSTNRSVRNSSVELLRILAIFMVLMLHCNYYSLGSVRGYSFEDCARAIFESLCVCAVDVFILITGYYGIRYDKLKILSILFQAFFCVVPVAIVVAFSAGIPISIKKLNFLGYWYVIAYIGLMLFSPLINTAIENIEKKHLTRFLISFYAFILLFDCILRDPSTSILGGYSVMWMIYLYVLARYINVRGIPFSRRMLVFLFIVFAVAKAATLLFHINGLRYSNPLILGEALCLLGIFTKTNFHNKLINKVAASVFMVYLMNLSPVILPYFVRINKYLYLSNPFWLYLIIALGGCVLFFIVSIIYDQLRIIAWSGITKIIYREK